MSVDNQDYDEIPDDVEFEVNIDPREAKLALHGIDQADFEEALFAALDARGEELEGTESDDVAGSLEEMSLTIGGKVYRLGDLATVSIEEAGDSDEDDE